MKNTQDISSDVMSTDKCLPFEYRPLKPAALNVIAPGAREPRESIGMEIRVAERNADENRCYEADSGKRKMEVK